MKMKSCFVFGISTAAGLTAGLAAAFFIATSGSLEADAALTSEYGNLAESFSVAATVFPEETIPQEETVPQEETAPLEEAAPQDVQPVYSCDIAGCPRTDYHQHGVCTIEDCTQTCPHNHDGVYCYPHHQNDGHAYHSVSRSGHHGGHHGGHH